MRPRWGSTPGRTDRLTVGGNVTLTLTVAAGTAIVTAVVVATAAVGLEFHHVQLVSR
jgi:hypothetical protein